MTTSDAKGYLSKREIPGLFESLMTGLMYHRPSDHIQYLIDCLQKVHEKGQENISWSSFVDIRRSKTPLPPINEKKRPSSKGSRPSSRTKTPKEESAPKQDARTSTPPLPAIAKDKVQLPDIPVVLVMGAPGSCKVAHVEKVMARYPDWKHYTMGSLIKEEIHKRGDAHTKWKLTKDLMSRGEPAPEDITIDVLLEALKGSTSAKGVVVTGFPRNMTQVGEFQKQVGRVDAAFMIDCDETKATETLLRRGKSSKRAEDTLAAIANRLNYFKANTLEAAKYYDDIGKLIVIDGDKDEAVVSYEIGKSFDDMFLTCGGAKPVGDAPAGANAPVPEASEYKGKYDKEDTEPEIEKDAPMFPGAVPEPPTISSEDTGRKPGLPEGPIIFVAGGPGSGKGTQCAKIVKRYPGFVHISMGDVIRTVISTKGTADEKWGMIATLVSKGEMAPEEEAVHLLKEELKKHSSAKAFVIEGFPRDKGQVESFNKEIGGLNFVMLFDCEEFYMQTRLMKRGKESGRVDDNLTAISNRLNFYKYNTLPILRHYELIGKLVVLNGDKDMDEMFFEISQLFDFAFFGQSQADKDVEKEGIGINDAASRIQASFRGYIVRRDAIQKGGSKQKADKKEMESKSKKKTSSKAYVTQASPNMAGKDLAMKMLGAGMMGLKLRDKDTHSKSKEKYVKKQDTEKPGAGKLDHGKVTASKSEKNKQAVEKLGAGMLGLKLRDKDAKSKSTMPAKSHRKQATEKPGAGKLDHGKVTASKSEQNKQAVEKLGAGMLGLKLRDKDAKSKSTMPAKSNKKMSKEPAMKKIMSAFLSYKEKKKPSEKSDDDEMIEASLRIQAGFRGYKTRQELQAKQAAGDKDKSQDEKEPAQGEVVEETIAPTEATTTGDSVENPAHSKELDQQATES